MRLPTPSDSQFVFEMRIPIRWGDMDPMGRVNNTVYFRYLEIARLEWMRSVRIDGYEQGEGLLMINTYCTFHKQLQFPGDVVVKCYVADVGSSSFYNWATIERADEPGVVYASGGATTVWSDITEKRSKPLPQGRAHLAPAGCSRLPGP